MWYNYEIILLQKGLGVKHENIWRKIWKIIQDLFFYMYMVWIFSIWLPKADFLMAIDVQVSDVVKRPLVITNLIAVLTLHIAIIQYCFYFRQCYCGEIVSFFVPKYQCIKKFLCLSIFLST